MTASLVKPKTCRRCAGTGFVETRVVHAGAPGGCFACAGEGVVEGDRATLAAAKAAYLAAQEECRRGGEAYALLLELRGEHPARMARFGLTLLNEREPYRYAAAVDAVLAGHPTVARHLHDYYRANRGA